jgi:hypothetical protein
MKIIEDVEKIIKPDGQIIFAKIWGSFSHNTNIVTSDIDYLGVYLAPTNHILGLKEIKETIVHEKPDVQLHEVGKFCRLLIKGNPGIVEALFTTRLYGYMNMWTDLMAMKNDFLTVNTVQQYLGYSSGQLKKLTNGTYLHTIGGKYNTKWAYHLIRLLLDAQRISKGEEPIVWKEGKERELLMDIRNEKVAKEDVTKMAQDIISEIDGRKPWPIPESPNIEMLNDWLVKIRKEAHE